MGSVIRKKTTNVFDIPQDILVEFIGRGLFINRNSLPPLLEISANHGIELKEDGSLGLKKGHSDHSSVYSFLTDVSLKLDGRRLILTKTISFYEITRNCDKFIVDIKFLHNDQIMEEVVFNDLGYCGMSTSFRENSQESPNFYSK